MEKTKNEPKVTRIIKRPKKGGIDFDAMKDTVVGQRITRLGYDGSFGGLEIGGNVTCTSIGSRN